MFRDGDAQTDVADTSLNHRTEGGCVIDAESRKIVAHSFPIPHSRRFYRYKILRHNSGTVEFGTVDLQNGKFDPVTFAPGYRCGLSFHGEYAIIDLSRPCDNKTFEGLPLEERSSEKNAEAQCGIQFANLVTGDAVN